MFTKQCLKQIHPVVRGHGKVNDKIPDDLLVISCEEDYAACAHLLNKGKTLLSSLKFEIRQSALSSDAIVDSI